MNRVQFMWGGWGESEMVSKQSPGSREGLSHKTFPVNDLI